MKTIASAIVALSIIVGIATQASAQTYGYEVPSVSQHQPLTQG
jgi:hypothetical protein